jgi:beta-lactamase regulating signal transducer with metallopeptidase domain
MIVSILVAGLWQGVPIVGLAWLISRLLSDRNATTRSALWFVTLLALAIVPVVAATFHTGESVAELLRGHSDPRGLTSISLIPADAFVKEAQPWITRYASWIVAIWLVGVAFSLARLTISLVRIEGIRRRARPLPSYAGVLVSHEIAVPAVAGIFAPAVLMPASLLGDFAPADLEAILAHECAHLLRHDSLLNLVQRLIEAFLFFNPWVRLASSSLCVEREAACDDWVVAKTGRSDEYAACLATIAQSACARSMPLLTPSVLGSRHALVARIERLGSNEPPRLPLTLLPLEEPSCSSSRLRLRFKHSHPLSQRAQRRHLAARPTCRPFSPQPARNLTPTRSSSIRSCPQYPMVRR